MTALGPVVMLLDDDAGDIFELWIGEKNGEAAGDTASLYKTFLGKLAGMVLRLPLVSELMAWAAGDQQHDPESISMATLVAVLDVVDSYAKPTAIRVFGDAALPASERKAALLARHIQRTKPQRINARDIRRSSGIPTLKVAQNVDDATDVLGV